MSSSTPSNVLASLFGSASAGMIQRWFRHLVAGGTGTLLYMAMVALLVELASLHPLVSVVLAYSVAVGYTYAINRLWVYASARSHFYALPRFLVVVVVAFALNAGIMFVAVEFMQWWYGWGLLIAALVVPPTNFLLNYYWAFR
jgi:putative flippase GtrA